MSGPMISQVGRNDPALIQYAMQSFGTINLTEEDWIKAEDHYKVIMHTIILNNKYVNIIILPYLL